MSEKPMNQKRKRGTQGHTPEGRAVTELIMSIFRTNGRLLRSGDGLTRDLGLTSARWQVLGAIEENPKTVAQIARDYELTRQGILWVVQSMVKDGLVELVTNPDHRRAKLVRFTETGRELYEEIARRQQSWSNDLGAQLDPQLVAAAAECVRRLGEIATSNGDAD